MTTVPVAPARDDDRRAEAPQSPGWWAVLDPANLATWAAPIALVLLAIVFQVLNPTFLSLGNLTSMLTSSAILIVLAIGQTFVVATAGIDLSIASAMTLAAVIFGIAFDAGLLAAVAAAVVTGLLVGLVNGLIISRGRITDFIVTLGMLSAASGMALIFADGKPKTIISAPLLKLSTGTVWIFGYSFLIAIALAAVAHVVLFHTGFAPYVVAPGGTRAAAAATGVSTARIKTAVYIIAGLTAGIAAILLVARVGAAEPASNTSFLLNSVAAVVLGGVSLFGGRATIAGPVVGALLLTGLVNGLTLLGVSQFYQPLSVGVVVVAAAFLTRFQK
jgi:putative xylitol transport system permease protein